MSEKQRLLNILSRFGDDISVESFLVDAKKSQKYFNKFRKTT